MAEIELRLMGDFAVLRDGQSQKLPPSKKTRALLAYLSLNARRFRRERLCELLWEIPDDPKGSVRWSLSKLRRLIDDADRPRIVADRVNVSIRSEDLAIDVVELRTLAGGDLTNEKLEAIETAATQFNGNFLEGLEFPNFHDFHTWCVAERAQALRDRGALLTELISRYADVPDQALPHARVLVGLSPYDETNRATLIRLLYAAGQPLEAEQQFQLGLRMLREVGATPSGALDAARRGPRIDMPRVEPTPERIPEPPLPEVGKGALVGREQEVTQLIQTMDAVRQTQQAAVVLIRGAPGIGKSRVLEVALDYAVRHDAMVCQATAFESDGLRPFSVWIDALRSADTEQYDRIFGNAVGNADRDQLFASLSGVVASHAAERLVVLVFDDMHWSDESSAAALHYVARMNRNSSVVAILAARGGELRDNAPVQQALRGLRREGLLQEIRLGPLADDALLSLIAEQAPDADKERLSRECGGNPLLAIELARAEIEGAGSGSLKELIRERLERFTVTGREVIHWAALLRPRIDVPTIVRITGLDAAEVGEVFEVAERNGMLLPGSKALRFPHDLVAQAVYTDISPLRRQVMHRRIAELLEQDTALDLAQASDLAHHAMQSGDPGLAARAMVSAGRLCLRFFANEEALSLARKGLVFAEQLDGAACVMAKVDLNDVILSAGPTGDWEAAAAEHLVGLAESALDHGALVHARLGYQMASYVRWAQGDWNAAREQSLQAERVTRGADNEEHVIGMAETAKCLVMLERDLTRADALLMEAEALADRRQFMHHAIHAGLGMLRYHENRLDEAEECFQQSRTLCKSAGDRINEFLANEYLVMIDLQRGRLQEARNRSEQLASLGEKIREGSEKPFAYALIGLCDYALGDPAKTLNAALEDLRLADAKYRLAYLLTRAALIDCERGEPQSASVRAQEALGYASILQRPTETLLAHAVLAYTNDAAETQAESARHGEEVDRLQPEAAVWAKDIATRLAALV
jgi:DNA-binding SARP family transcriptional activator/tetratricopeptide (TPR) repeat protein